MLASEQFLDNSITHVVRCGDWVLCSTCRGCKSWILCHALRRLEQSFHSHTWEFMWVDCLRNIVILDHRSLRPTWGGLHWQTRNHEQLHYKMDLWHVTIVIGSAYKRSDGLPLPVGLCRYLRFLFRPPGWRSETRRVIIPELLETIESVSVMVSG